MRSKTLFLVLILALVLSACGGIAESEDQAARTLSVSSNGMVYLTPDIAYIYIGVHTEDADIAVSVARNNAQAQRVADALRGMGVDAKDIQTSNFSVWSSQQYDSQTGEYSGYTYAVDNTVYVTVRDLARLGELLDAAIRAGANNINSIQFDVADKTEALQEARQLAINNANALADELAGAASLTLGSIQTLSYTDYTPGYYYGYGLGGGGGGGAEASTPINPRQIPLTVSVSITYAIK